MRLLFFLSAAVMLVGCPSDRERTTESLAAFADAVVVHRAPYHAYALLDTSDKQFVTMESWATTFDQLLPVYPPGTTVSVGEVEVQGDRGTGVLTIAAPAEDAQTETYVLRREGTKWRVWLGLEVLAQQRATLDEARQLASEGALDLAREKVESVVQAAFPASRPHAIEAEVLALRQKLADDQRFARLDARFNAAMQAELATMATELEELRKLVAEDDEALYPRLALLAKELAKARKQAAIDNFEFTDVRARLVRDRWGTFHEVQLATKNTTGRPLSQLSVRLSFLNEGNTTPLGTALWELVEEGATLDPGAAVTLKREVAKAPEGWDGTQVELRAEELVFADGDPDDAG